MPNYTVTWQPVPGLLFSRPETDAGISYDIACSIGPDPEGLEPAPVITGYQAELSGGDGPLVLSSSASGVTISAESLSGLFGVAFIDYQKGSLVARAYGWEGLPSQFDELVEFRPSGEVERTFTLDVTAELSNRDSEAATYTITVTQDWTAGRDRLRIEFNGRGNATG